MFIHGTFILQSCERLIFQSLDEQSLGSGSRTEVVDGWS